MEFSKLLQTRRSVRAYRAGETVTAAEIRELMEAVRLAPTWKNSETGRYYAAVTPEAVAAVRAALPDFNQNSTANASAYIVTTFVPNISGFKNGVPDNEPGNEWGAYDLGLQNSYLLLKAADMGLDTLIMGLRDADALRAYFSIPAEEHIMAVIAVGKRGGEPVFRPRKDVDEFTVIR